jgi:hypothetical protein
VKVYDLHSEELREEVAQLVAESAHLREEAKNNELQMRMIAARLAEIEKEVATQSVMHGYRIGACVEWRPGASAPAAHHPSKETCRISLGSIRARAASA